MTRSRKNFPTRVIGYAWMRCGGRCEIHRLPDHIEGWAPSCDRVAKELDHIMPDCLGGEPTLENSAYLCREHHRDKTRDDAAMRGKRNAHTPRKDRPKSGWFQGQRQKLQGRGFQTNKDSPFKAKIGGGVERRDA